MGQCGKPQQIRLKKVFFQRGGGDGTSVLTMQTHQGGSAKTTQKPAIQAQGLRQGKQQVKILFPLLSPQLTAASAYIDYILRDNNHYLNGIMFFYSLKIVTPFKHLNKKTYPRNESCLVFSVCVGVYVYFICMYIYLVRRYIYK